MEYSVVIPIHNEENILPYTLPSIQQLHPPPQEVVAVFDRCTDRSQETTQRILGSLLKPVEIAEESGWALHMAYVKRTGFKHASSPVILNTDADVILDPRCAEYVGDIGVNNLAMISFNRVNMPWNFRHHISRLFQRVFPESFYGQYLLSKKAWRDAENQEKLAEMKWSEDSFLFRSVINKGYRYRFQYDTRNIHLRERENMENWMRKGHARRQMGHPLWKAAAHSAIFLRPGVLVGWLHG